jgi:tetratricopeptide (TPR) repeat protein
MFVYKSTIVRHILLILILLFSVSPLMSEAPQAWGSLEAGKYDVGFKTIESYDYSRVFRPKKDYFGDPLEGERARPVVAAVWYPAVHSGDDIKMSYAEYAFLYPNDDRFFNLLANIQTREIQQLQGVLQNAAIVLDIMNSSMAAVRNAPPAEGTFPVIVYFPDLIDSHADNAILCEFLASHGYVVLSTPALGTSSLTPEQNTADLENLIRDKEYALGLLHGADNIDPNKLAVMGLGVGGLGALDMQMRNSDVDAVVSLDGIYALTDQLEFSRHSPSFNLERMTIPLLHLIAEDTGEHDLSIINNLKYSSRNLVNLTDNSIQGLTHYPMFSFQFPDELKQMAAPMVEAYPAVCKLVLVFLDANLKAEDEKTALYSSDSKGAELPALFSDIRNIAAEQIPPTQEQFLAIINTKGIDTAAAVFEKFHELEPDRVFFTEMVMNITGYRYLQSGNTEAAITAFMMNTVVYPESANTWDSLSDGYLSAGDNDNAIKCMKKALEKLQTDMTTTDDLKDQIRRKCEHTLQELQG